MEPCPNCAAPTRVGAKFCTTCGHPLTAPAVAADEAGAGTAAAPHPPAAVGSGAADSVTGADGDTDGYAAADHARDGGAAPVVEPSVSPLDVTLAADPATPEPPLPPPALTEPTEGKPAAAPDDQVLSSSWPAPSATAWPSGWGAPAEPAPSPPDASVWSTDVSFAAASAWPGLPADDAAGTADPPEPSADATAEAEPDAEPVADVDLDLDDRAGGAAEAVDPTAVAPDVGGDLLPAVPLPDPVFPPLVDDADATDGAVAAHAAEGDPAARAAALVDELRALLPALTAAPPVDLAALAADLDAALVSAPADEADRAALRAAAAAAHDRPRDIDALLDLAARADALLDLFDAHDRLLAAAERALAALRLQTEGTP